MSGANTVCLPPINILNGFYSGLISLVSSFKLNLFLIMNGFPKLRNYYARCLQIALKGWHFMNFCQLIIHMSYCAICVLSWFLFQKLLF